MYARRCSIIQSRNRGQGSAGAVGFERLFHFLFSSTELTYSVVWPATISPAKRQIGVMIDSLQGSYLVIFIIINIHN